MSAQEQPNLFSSTENGAALSGVSGVGEEVGVLCFPYGLMKPTRYSLDFTGDAKERILDGFYWSLGVIAWIFIIVVTYRLLEIVGFFLLAGVLWGVRQSGIDSSREHVEDSIRRLWGNNKKKISKLREIRATKDGLYFYRLKGKSKEVSRGSAEKIDTKAVGGNLKPLATIVNFFPWESLEAVRLFRPANSSLSMSQVYFESSCLKDTFVVSLCAIHTYENWTRLVQAIREHAPQATIADEITEALRLPSLDTSFTEIWLKSISRLPEEESLVPVSNGQSLNNGRYTVLQELSCGGQGVAYLAQDTSSGLKVVIKEYLLPVYQGRRVKDQAVRELEAEAVMLQRIHHPQIVQFIDWFCESNCAFLVLKQAQGQNLRRWLELEGLPAQDLVKDLVGQMCEILQYLHSFKPPIIHRDFTPDNLIIDGKNQLTLIDFTIAEPTGAVSGLPPAGKPAYMPPEQFRGESIVQSDIYALGGTIYFLLTGQDPVALFQSNPQEVRPDIDESLAQVVLRCRAQEAGARFGSAGELKQFLEKRQAVLKENQAREH